MINRCDFIGRLGKDPEARQTQSGTAVTSFSIACSEKWKGKDGQMQESTEWVNVVAWDRLGEICGEYLSKGSLVYVSGKLQTRKWEDNEGNARYTTEIVAREMKMLSPKSESGGVGQYGGMQEPPPIGGDVPF